MAKKTTEGVILPCLECGRHVPVTRAFCIDPIGKRNRDARLVGYYCSADCCLRAHERGCANRLFPVS